MGLSYTFWVTIRITLGIRVFTFIESLVVSFHRLGLGLGLVLSFRHFCLRIRALTYFAALIHPFILPITTPASIRIPVHPYPYLYTYRYTPTPTSILLPLGRNPEQAAFEATVFDGIALINGHVNGANTSLPGLGVGLGARVGNMETVGIVIDEFDEVSLGLCGVGVRIRV